MKSHPLDQFIHDIIIENNPKHCTCDLNNPYQKGIEAADHLLHGKVLFNNKIVIELYKEVGKTLCTDCRLSFLTGFYIRKEAHKAFSQCENFGGSHEK